MSDSHIDPAGNTQAFRAFARQRDAEAAREKRSGPPKWLAPVIVVVVALAVVAGYLLIR